MRAERRKPGRRPGGAKRAGVTGGERGRRPRAGVRQEHLRAVRAADPALVHHAGRRVGAATDVRAEPHTRYSVTVEPRATVVPASGRWLNTMLPDVLGTVWNATCRPASRA